ncbi:type VII secretion integral membrane protein EccD [Stackebrandtia albiflava]|uniref:Type VII secretion integral membrane protein EccD n=1 Tax=Stackebrandtia albiflava TaxID=406432 RepID=A0A562VC60_9ACTN|nr:type VII secretion integral membrane protein EccD [Stackebrandtia albiflava]TWJ15401.1 type VII secretion integral membrane protein EccD [Stackebrandtia albiflava]
MTFVVNPLCRVTIVSPHTRMDVALPAHIPLVELQAELLAQSAASPDGEGFVEEGVEVGGWTLARLGEPPMDPDLSCAQLGIADGEELYFRPAPDTAPAAVFDDVVDAVATAAVDRAGAWRSTDTRRVGLVAGSLAIVAALVTAAGVPGPGTTAVVVVCGLVGLAGAWALERAFGMSGPAVLTGSLGVLAGFLGGTLVVAEGRFLTEYGAAQWLAGGCAAIVFSVIATLTVNRPTPPFLASLTAGIGLALGAALCLWFDVPAAASAAVITGVALLAIPALPMLSYRLAKLPLPDVPTNPEELRGEIDFADDEGDRLLARSDFSDAYLAGLLAGCAAVMTVAVMVLAATPTVPATVLAAVVSMLMLVKSRDFHTVRMRVPVLVVGFAGPATLAAVGAAALPPTQRLFIVAGALAAGAVVLFIHALGVAGRRIPPLWGRIGDVLHIVLAVAVIPLTLWVWDLYWWIRTILAAVSEPAVPLRVTRSAPRGVVG